MSLKQLNRIGILCYYHFPEGMAPTNRIIAYGKGLVQNGVQCDVYIFRPRLSTDIAPEDGYISGVHYRYAYTRNSQVSLFRKILVDRPMSLIRTLQIIRREHRKKAFDTIFLSFDSLPFLFVFVPILRLMGLSLTFIGDEYPIPIRQKLKSRLPLWKIVCYKVVFLGIHLRILMTEALKEFFNTKISKKTSHILPTITDVDRFLSIGNSERPSMPYYICYMGNMELSKDNVDNIIAAYAIFVKKHPQIELHLYGTPSSKDYDTIRDQIQNLNLIDKIIFKGRADYEVVPSILAGSILLVTSQPLTKRAEGGFPTKLGEYLMSGKPTILTNVGELAKYITDGQNAYMVEPCNPRIYADKMEYIIEHYDEALQVARKGKEYIQKYFNPQYVSANLKQFLETNL